MKLLYAIYMLLLGLYAILYVNVHQFFRVGT